MTRVFENRKADDMESTQQTVVRDGDPSLTFDGWLLGETSSHKVGKQTWTEIFIYRTVGDAYVVSIIGRADKDGWVDRHNGSYCSDVIALFDSLTEKRGGDAKLSRLALGALELAADHDEAISKALDAREERTLAVK